GGFCGSPALGAMLSVFPGTDDFTDAKAIALRVEIIGARLLHWSANCTWPVCLSAVRNRP
ncbi:hypothetical protein NAV26_22190, partial [Pseudomonas stutzeri]|uniref:hypothetical protein n=1 Tax=Stutzerimonas stutzeri TaxID=316 RepID=UPI00210C440C